MNKPNIYRRDFMKYTGLGVVGLAIPGIAVAGKERSNTSSASETFNKIYEKVCNTRFIDTHEHLLHESARLSAGDMIGDKEKEPWTYYANDWSYLFSHYFSDDLAASGLDDLSWKKIYLSAETGMMEKWDLIEPYWPYVKYSGYGLSIRIALKELYGIDEVNRETIPALQQGYKELIRPGYYGKVINEVSGIESCQVNHWPYHESEIPNLLHSDLDVGGLILGGLIIGLDQSYSRKAGIRVKNLEDWHGVIDYYFDWYGKRSVAIKIATAYRRNIDFMRTEAAAVKEYFGEIIAGKTLDPDKEKMLQDHLFWYCVDKATSMNLPVKLHTGYYAGHDGLNLSRISGNPGAACELCRQSADTKFVFFHIGYPYYEEMIAVAKNYTNATVDMCWSWIINPVASKDFLKKFILTAPLNKVTVFGGDYFAVEMIPGHARIARTGIAQALSELVEESWIGMDDALWMTDILMHENASKLYQLNERNKELGSIDWKALNTTI